jgi:hypothetical protein
MYVNTSREKNQNKGKKKENRLRFLNVKELQNFWKKINLLLVL